MNKLKWIGFYLFALCLFTVVACGDDDDGNGPGGLDCTNSVAVNQEIADEVDAIAAAANAYSMDQSAANCNALKAAYQNYFNELQDLQSCANQAGVGQEFADAIADAQANIDNLNC